MTENADLIQALLDAADAGDDEAAEKAAQACTGRAGLLPALRPLLTAGNPDRRWWAVRTLVLLRNSEAAGPLIERLADADEAVRCAAALALGTLRSERAIPGLVACLADPSGWVRDSAADGLALIGEPAVPALAEALANPHPGVRVRAASALRRIGSRQPVALNALFHALNDTNYLVHEHAFDALDRMGLLDNLIVM